MICNFGFRRADLHGHQACTRHADIHTCRTLMHMKYMNKYIRLTRLSGMVVAALVLVSHVRLFASSETKVKMPRGDTNPCHTMKKEI